jgi:hypothetical protein
MACYRAGSSTAAGQIQCAEASRIVVNDGLGDALSQPFGDAGWVPNTSHRQNPVPWPALLALAMV